jgi:hypothetical protein
LLVDQLLAGRLTTAGFASGLLDMSLVKLLMFFILVFLLEMD